jgi:hypothetical protein
MTQAIIAGGRDYELTAEDLKFLNEQAEAHALTEVVHNGIGLAVWGADLWAMAHGIPVISFKAHRHRHRDMLAHVGPRGVLITFAHDRSVADLVKQAKAKGLLHIPRGS